MTFKGRLNRISISSQKILNSRIQYFDMISPNDLPNDLSNRHNVIYSKPFLNRFGKQPI